MGASSLLKIEEVPALVDGIAVVSLITGLRTTAETKFSIPGISWIASVDPMGAFT